MRVSTAFVLLSSANLVQGFSPIATPTSARNSFSSLNAEKQQIESFDPLNLSSQEDNINGDFNDNLKTGMLPLVTLLALTPEAANAAPSPDWGLFEGKTGSLLHPVIMGSMFALSLSTALKGFQYRRQRTMGAEIKALKQTLPSLNGASNLSAAIASAQAAEEVDSAMIAKLQSAMPIENEINALLAERKELSSKGLKDGHFSQGAILAFLGTAFAIEGPLNTYARAGKLFPGPHLYAGAGLVVLWAAAAACVPAMQKGNDTARSIHIAANVSGMGLFAWQIVSGWPILLKVNELTKWP
jgi:hypothetical protein